MFGNHMRMQLVLPLLLAISACTVSPEDPLYHEKHSGGHAALVQSEVQSEAEPEITADYENEDSVHESDLWSISNPYETVDWERFGRYKANFHTHTTVSDGVMNPHTAVDRYHELGYDILAITDHDVVTYPWTAFSALQPSTLSINRLVAGNRLMPADFSFQDRDPEAFGMTAIEGNEYSRHHHTGGYFSGIGGSSSLDETLQELAADGGIAMLFHPGRYTPPLRWYVDLYMRYEHLFGIEVYNQGDRYPGDRIWWDRVLSETMPERPVWGYSNDDMHTAAHLGFNWNIILLPSLTPDHVRDAMMQGTSWFVYAPRGHKGASPPSITRVNTDEREGTISLSAKQYESVSWLTNGEVVGEELHLAFDTLPAHAGYIRAELYGKDGTVVGTQPFGVIRLAAENEKPLSQ